MKTLKTLMEVLKENETRTESMGIQIITFDYNNRTMPSPFPKMEVLKANII